MVEGLLELAFGGLGDHFGLRGAALFVLVYGAAVEVVDHFELCDAGLEGGIVLEESFVCLWGLEVPVVEG